MLKHVMKSLKNNICRAKQFFKILEFLDLIGSQSFRMMCLFSGGRGRGRLRLTVGWMGPWGFDMKPRLFGCDFKFWIGCGASLLSYPEIGFHCYFRASLVQICTSLNMLSSLRASLTCGMFMWAPIAVTWITILSKQVCVHCFMQYVYARHCSRGLNLPQWRNQAWLELHGKYTSMELEKNQHKREALHRYVTRDSKCCIWIEHCQW